MINAQQAAAKWATNTSAATESFKLGVQGVTDSPMEKAANQAQAYLSGIQAAVSSGRFQAALRAVPLQSWKDAMLNKGAQRMAQGVQLAKPKMQSFLSQWLPIVEQEKRNLDATMPRGSLDQNLARATAIGRALAQYKGKVKGA